MPHRPDGVRPLTHDIEFGVGHQRLGHFGVDIAGPDRVGLDVVRRPFRRHRSGQHLDAALGRRVGRDRRSRDLARERGDVDDLAAAPARDHPPGRLAPDLERAGEMGLDDAAPFVGLELEHRLPELEPGVVDEDVDLDARGVEMLEGGENRAFVGDIEGPRRRVPPVRLEGLGDCRQLALVAAVEDDSRAGRRKAARDRQPEAVRGSGDERRLARQIEEMGHAHRRAHRARSTRIGVWSEALSRPRMALSMATERSRSAAWDESSR